MAATSACRFPAARREPWPPLQRRHERARDPHTPHQHHHDREREADGDAERHVGGAAQPDADVERQEQRSSAAHEDDDHGGDVQQVLDGHRRDRRAGTHAPLHEDDLRWLADQDAKRRDIAERVSHHRRAERGTQRKPARIVQAHPPGDRAQQIPNATEQADHHEPPANPVDAVTHGLSACGVNGPEEQQRSASAGRQHRETQAALRRHLLAAH